MNTSHSLIPFVLQQDIWSQTPFSILLAAVCCLHRNCAGYFFPERLSSHFQQEIIERVEQGMHQVPQLIEPQFFRAEQLLPYEKEFLFEHFFALESFQHAHSGEGFVIDRSGRFFMPVNIGDHLQLQLMVADGQIEESWKVLVALDQQWQRLVPMAYSPRFGFLSANPAQSGTGFSLYAHLHLPALIHTRALEAETAVLGSDVAVGGMQGSLQDIVGDVVTVRNAYSLGLAEEKIIFSVESAIAVLVNAEKAARQKMQKEGTRMIKDRIARAWGLLRSAYELETIETLDALSLCQLGIDLGWLEGISSQRIKNLFFGCRHAHLLRTHGTNLSNEQIARQRALLLQQELQDTKVAV